MSRGFIGLAPHLEINIEPETGWNWDGLPPKLSFWPKTGTFSPFRAIEGLDAMGKKHGGDVAQNVVGGQPTTTKLKIWKLVVKSRLFDLREFP